MANFRLLSSIAAAGVVVVGVSTGIAWAGGPDGGIDPEDIYAAVGSGSFTDSEVGFKGTGDTAEEASQSVLSQCNAAGGVDCTVDEYTDDKLCIVSVGDDVTDVIAGGAGPTVQAAKEDALARAAANGTPMDASATVIISDCP